MQKPEKANSALKLPTVLPMMLPTMLVLFKEHTLCSIVTWEGPGPTGRVS